MLTVWNYCGKDSNGLYYDYELSVEKAYDYFSNRDKDCIASGWVICPYVVNARIVLQGNGKFRILSMQSKNTFETIPDTLTLYDWKEKNGVIYLSDNGVLLFNEITQ